MDRFAGAISSAAVVMDLDLVWCDGASNSPSLVDGRSLSNSESDVRADADAEDGDRLFDFRLRDLPESDALEDLSVFE